MLRRLLRVWRGGLLAAAALAVEPLQGARGAGRGAALRGQRRLPQQRGRGGPQVRQELHRGLRLPRRLPEQDLAPPGRAGVLRWARPARMYQDSTALCMPQTSNCDGLMQ